jgi:ppGpp synthetase/RelA/SpoT-type nucleotidyltranferase
MSGDAMAGNATDSGTNLNQAQPSEEALYKEARRLAKSARAQIKTEILSTLRRLGDPHLIRARIARSRIKTLESLRRKAAGHGWSFPEALSRARDIIGFRIVCDNLQDARRAYELLSSALKDAGLKLSTVDYVKTPQPGGYRAIHLWFPYDIQAGPSRMTLHCEVQIHSLLQDVWAKLSHVDLYRGDPPPAMARAMARLSDRLSKADKVADGISVRIARPRRGRKGAAGNPLTAASLAFLYRHTFGADPPDYLIQSTLDGDLAGTPVRADGLAALLTT